MAIDRPPPRGPATRRSAGPPPKIPTGPKLGPIAPYVIAAAAVAGLIYLVRQPRYALPGALVLGLGIIAALGYVAAGYRISLPPDDSLRRVLPLVTILAVVAAAVPYYYTLMPPPPHGEVALRAPGESGSVEVRGTVTTAWITVRGQFVPEVVSPATYSVSVSRAGSPPERVDGTFEPHEGGPEPVRHVLRQARGPGRYSVTLQNASPAVRLPLRVSFSAKPFSTALLAMIFGALAAVIIAVDVMLWRRGLDPSFAAALCLPLAAVLYFQRHPASDALSNDLLAAAIIGALGGGLGGEVVSRVVRAVVGK